MCSYVNKGQVRMCSACGCIAPSKLTQTTPDINNHIVWDEYDMGVVYLNRNSEYSDEVMKAFEFIESVYGYNFDKEEGMI